MAEQCEGRKRRAVKKLQFSADHVKQAEAAMQPNASSQNTH